MITLEEWKNRVLFINPDMELLNETLPKGTKDDPFICHCNKCGATMYKTKTAIVSSYQMHKTDKYNNIYCPCCNGAEVYTGINDIATIRKDLVKYFANPDEAKLYTCNSNEYAMFKCPYCNYKKKLCISNIVNYKFCCPICSDNISYPNKIGRLVLSRLPVDEYIIEYEKEWTLGKVYDGYFIYNNEKYLLEFDGSQHFRDSKWTTLEQQKENDEIKNQLAKINNYKLIRIDCMEATFDYIKNSFMNSELSKLFDLSLLNWKEIQELSLNNLFLSIVEYYNNHPTTCVEIGRHFNICGDTVSRYLRKADKLNLVDYKPHKYRPSYIYDSRRKNKKDNNIV